MKEPPKFPCCRIIVEGTIGTCPKCDSTEIENSQLFYW